MLMKALWYISNVLQFSSREKSPPFSRFLSYFYNLHDRDWDEYQRGPQRKDKMMMVPFVQLLWLLTLLAILRSVLFGQKNASSRMVICLSSSPQRLLRQKWCLLGKGWCQLSRAQLPARIRRSLFSAELWKWENASSLTNKKPTQHRSSLWPLFKGTTLH